PFTLSLAQEGLSELKDAFNMAVPGLPATKLDHGTADEEARHEAQDAAAHLATSASLIGTDNKSLAAFFSAFTLRASPEDLVHFTGGELAALVKQVFERSARRSPGKTLIEVFEPSASDPAFARRETVVLAVNDDIPFLYDSATAEMRAEGVTVSAAFHPVINEIRDLSGARVIKGAAIHESVIVLILDSIVDEASKAAIKEGLTQVFASVALVVRDWKPMLARLATTIAQLKQNPPPIPDADLSENLAFLGWLADNHFTFLGCRDYVFHADGGGKLEARYESGLGVLAEPAARVIRRGADRSSLTPELREFLTRPAPLIITKSSTRSIVHRRAHMDYVGVKSFDA